MIVGFSIRYISAERKTRPKGRINIKSTPNIVSISQAKSGLMRKKKHLDIGFEFTTKYEPDVGEIRIIGNALYIGKGIKKIMSNWKKEKKLPKEFEIEIKNFLFRKCLSIGLTLSENMQLPPPIMFPAIIPKRTPKKPENLTYIG